jgi:hypothetical protein
VPSSQQLFTALVRTHLVPVLRKHGYAGSGQHFHRRFGENWAAVFIERSKYSSAAEIQFMVNLGTKSAHVMAEQGLDPDQPVMELLCDWRARLGHVGSPWIGTSWTIRADMTAAELATLGETVATLLEEQGLPEIERMGADAAILGEVRPPAEWTPRFGLDIAAPILRAIGPAAEYEKVLGEIDALPNPLALFGAQPIGKMTPKRAVSYLRDLQSRDWGTRSFAALELGAAEPSDAVIRALRLAVVDPVAAVRGHAARSLGALGDVESSDALLRILATDPPRAAVSAGMGLVSLDAQLPSTVRAAIADAVRHRRGESAGTHRAAFGALLAQLEARQG